MSEVMVTDAMVDAGLNAWWDGSTPLDHFSPDVRASETRDMRASLTAALAVSGYGEVVEALRATIGPLRYAYGHVSSVTADKVKNEILPAANAALSRLTPAIANTIVSQGN